MSRSLSLSVALTLLAGGAWAQLRTLATAPAGTVPGGIHYQGRLEDNGLPAQGARTMRFRLYDQLAQPGGTLVWDSGDLAVSVSQGIFGADLAIPVSALSGAAAKFLEVTVSGVILSPREALGTVPYALIAKTIEGTLDVQSGGLTISSAPTSTNPSIFVSPADGSVGIGTSSPGASLEVRNGGGTQVLLTGAGGNTGIQFAPSGGFADLRATTADAADSKTLRLSGGGDVTTPRGAVLSLQGNEGGGEATLSAGDGGNFILLQNGNVGVNAASPATRLEVNGDAQFGTGAAKSTVTAAGSLQLVANSTISSGGSLSISTAATVALTGTPALFIDQAGRTGLATTAPARTLDVVGDAQFGSGAGKSVFSSAGALTLAPETGLALSGAGGTIASASSVTASGFFGDGAGLTNVAGGSLQAGSVDTAKLAADSVVASKLLDAAVQTAKLAADSVSSAKLLSDSGGLAKVTGGAASSSGGNVTVAGVLEGQSFGGLGSAGAASSPFTLTLNRSFTTSGGSGAALRSVGQVAGGAADNVYGVSVANSFAEAASGLHTVMAQLHLAAPPVANDGGDTLDLATLYIAGAPTGIAPSGLGPFSVLVAGGDSWFGGNVTIRSPAGGNKLHVSSGSLLLDGDGAKLETSGNTALSAVCQGGGSPAVTGTDVAGQLNVGATPGTDCTITFRSAYANAPICVASNRTSAAAVRPVSGTSTLQLIGALAASDLINYICIGRR